MKELFFTTILNIKITLNDKKDIIDCVLDYLQKKSGRPLIIYTPNPEQIVQAKENPEFARVLNSADINLPDGKRLVWALKMQNVNIKMQNLKRIPGVEFMEELVKIAAEKGYPVGFIGGRKGSASEALAALQKKYPRLEGWAEEGPDLRFKNLDLRDENDQNFHKSLIINHKSKAETDHYFIKLAQRIKDNAIRLVFVGLGAPKQEFFIEKLKYFLSSRTQREIPLGIPRLRRLADPRDDKRGIIFMSVGGAFEIISGRLPRVPKTLSNFEFIWRLILEPGRFVRQLRLLRFIFLVFRQRFVLK